MSEVDQHVELAARNSYGRLLAWLSSRCGDVALAEDVLGDALRAAMESWSSDGVPDNPEAWLLSVSRRRLIDRRRRGDTQHKHVGALRQLQAERLQREAAEVEETPFRDGVPERRLELMFVCAHPDLPRNVRAPLMLQAVLGLTADEIAGTMLVTPSALGQRLVRAKRRITELELPFEVPAAHELPERTADVLEAIYAAYGAGWDASGDGADKLDNLAGEAIWLSRMLVDWLPDSGEVKGLYALLLYCESRRGARRVDGEYVPLHLQDVALWNATMIEEAEKALWMASKCPDAGPFQTEAAIQSVHAHRKESGETDWRAIHELYQVLVRLYPTVGAKVGLAASQGRLGEVAGALQTLDDMPENEIARYQPYWAVRAWLLDEIGYHVRADECRQRAIGLTSDPTLRRWLTAQRRRG